MKFSYNGTVRFFLDKGKVIAIRAMTDPTLLVSTRAETEFPCSKTLVQII
jgi:hypothetical protein